MRSRCVRSIFIIEFQAFHKGFSQSIWFNLSNVNDSSSGEYQYLLKFFILAKDQYLQFNLLDSKLIKTSLFKKKPSLNVFAAIVTHRVYLKNNLPLKVSTTTLPKGMLENANFPGPTQIFNRHFISVGLRFFTIQPKNPTSSFTSPEVS